jgi:hypothetical protein
MAKKKRNTTSLRLTRRRSADVVVDMLEWLRRRQLEGLGKEGG